MGKMVTLNPEPQLTWYLIQRKDMPPKCKYYYQFREVAVQAYSKKEALAKLESRPDILADWEFNKEELTVKKLKKDLSNKVQYIT